MPPVPPACQPIANDVTALETNDAQLVASLKTLTGAAAWTVLAQLADGRQQLVAKRAQLDACVLANSAALQANVVTIDLGASPPTSQSRSVQMWDMTAPVPVLRESAAVVGDSIAIKGPLPASFGLTVITIGDPDVLGPDFRSQVLAGATPPTRLEVLLGPMIRISRSSLEASLGTVLPYVTQIDASGHRIDLAVSTGRLATTPGRLTAIFSGQASAPSFGFQNIPFSSTVNIGLVPSSAPAIADAVDLVRVEDISLDMPGLLGALASLAIPSIRTFVEGFATDQLRTILRIAVPNAVQEGFALAGLPADVNLSIRKIAIDGDGILFEPALGAVGTTLSTFAPTNIPPP